VTGELGMSVPLKTDPKYGYYPWWPEDGDDWIHPEDVEVARSLIPSGRVFRRDGEQGEMIVLHYGPQRLRVRRTLWKEVEPEGFDIGDMVEIAPRGMNNAPRTGVIREVLWDDDAGGLRYQITEAGVPLEKLYTRDDLLPVTPREDREEVRIEPPADDEL
jgi:hypothetical protein